MQQKTYPDSNSLIFNPLKAIFGILFLSFSFISSAQQISIGSPNDAIEGSGIVSVVVSLDNGGVNNTGAPITGDITLTGTAVNGVDYSGPTSFSIADGSSSIGILVPVIDDALVEPTESIIFTISNLNVGTVSNASTTAFIFDDDSGSLMISIGPAADGAEPGTNITFDVFIDGGAVNNTGSDITGTITYTGTAQDGIDFTGPTSFVIPVGVNSSTISVPVIDDLLLEDMETVDATISNISVGTVGNQSSTANILDNENGIISISSPIMSVVEGSGSNITFDVFLEGGVINSTGSAITGNLSLSGTATNSVDYTGVTSFSIPDGANSTTITIVVIDDAIVEATESVIATISNPSYGNIGTSTSTVNIIDDDAGGLFISIGVPVDGMESAAPSSISFDVFIEGGGVNTTGSAITGSLSYAGTATPSVDFTSVTTFSIPNGANSTTLTLPIIDDFNTEPTESVIANLVGSPSIGTYANTSSTAYILDDDASSLTISIGSPVDGTEGGGAISFLVSLDNGAVNNTGSAILGTVSLSGTATPGSDYNNLASTFTIPDGASSTLIIYLVLDDLIPEPTETVIATISAPTIGIISASNTSTANIVDNDSTNGFNELHLNALKVTMYPNPVNSILTLEADQQMTHYSIVDLNGREMTSAKLNAKNATLNVENLPKGCYFVKVKLSDGSTANKKVLKN